MVLPVPVHAAFVALGHVGGVAGGLMASKGRRCLRATRAAKDFGWALEQGLIVFLKLQVLLHLALLGAHPLYLLGGYLLGYKALNIVYWWYLLLLSCVYDWYVLTIGPPVKRELYWTCQISTMLRSVVALECEELLLIELQFNVLINPFLDVLVRALPCIRKALHHHHG